MSEATLRRIEQSLADLRQTVSSEGRNLPLVDATSLLADLDQILQSSLVTNEDFARAAGTLLNESDGVFAFVNALLNARRAQGGDSTSEITSALKESVDLVDRFISIAQRRIRASGALQIAAQCVALLKRTFGTKGLAALQEACFQPLQRILLLSADLAIDAASLGVTDILDLLLRTATKQRMSAGQKVRKQLLETLGLLSKVFPAEVSPKARDLHRLFMESLDNLVRSPTPEFTTAAGLLNGLTHFLHHFGGSVAEGQGEWLRRVYQFMVRGLELTDHTRYEVPKAALQLLQHHARQFKEFLAEDAVGMIERIRTLGAHKNVYVQKATLPACDPFAATLGFELVNGTALKEAQNTFRAAFAVAMEMLGGNGRHVSIGVILIGHLAAAAARFNKPAAVGQIISTLLEKFSHLFAMSQATVEESVRQMPFFLSSLAAAVAANEGDLPADILDGIADVVRTVWLHYTKHYVFESTRARTRVSLLHLFSALVTNGEALGLVLQRVCFQCLVLTISSERGSPLYPDYLPMWTALMNRTAPHSTLWSFPWDTVIAISPAQHSCMTALVFDHVVNAVFSLMQSFDLSVTLVGEGDVPTVERKAAQFEGLTLGEHTGLRPRVPKDFELFLNLVRFWSLLFNGIADAALVVDWALVLAKNFIEHSMQHPHISGYYHLLTSLIGQCTRFSLFDAAPVWRDADGDVFVGPVIPTEKRKKELELSIVDDSLAGEAPLSAPVTQAPKAIKDAAEIQTLLLQFIDLSLARVAEYKGELLVACISFLLRLPLRLLNLRKMQPPLRLAFHTGLSYPPIAALAATALEAWLDTAPSAVHRHLAPSLIALVQKFVATAHKLETSAGEDEQASQSKAKGKKVVKRPRNDLRRGFRLFDQKDDVPDMVQLHEVQLQMVRVLGKLGTGVVTKLLDDLKEKDDTEGRWDSQTRVVMRLTFGDVKQDVAFDHVLPRVCELAQSSSDRKAKIAACELLHSVVVWMIGTNAYSARSRGDDSAAQEATPFHNIYRRVFPVVVRLAVDAEPIAQQLFEKLVIQLVHWLTQNVHYESKETMALLDTLVEGITTPDDSALRDLCSAAIAEFMTYSIKYGTETSRRNVLSLTSRLYSLCHHPHSSKRLGAAVAFTRMLPKMKGHDDLIASHLLATVYHGILSLASADADGDQAGTVPPLVIFLHKAERMVVCHSSLLTDPTDKRRQMLPMPCRGLELLVRWLLEQCFFEEHVSRRMAMRLFLTFASCLVGYDSADDGPRRWLAKELRGQGGIAEVAKMSEGRMMKLPEQVDKVKDMTLERYKTWCIELETCADAYHWLFAHHLLEPDDVLSEHSPLSPPHKKKRAGDGSHEGSHADSTILPRHVYYFLHHAASPDAVPTPGIDSQQSFFETQTLFDESRHIPTLTPKEQAAVNRCKAKTLEAIIPLVSLLSSQHGSVLKAASDPKTPGNYPLLSPPLYRVLLRMLMRPSMLGYCVHAVRTQTEVGLMSQRAIQSVWGELQSNPTRWAKERKVFAKEVADFFRGKENDIFGNLAGVLEGKEQDAATETAYLVRGARALVRMNLLVPALGEVHPGLDTEAIAAAALAGSLSLLPQPVVAQPGSRQVIRQLWQLTFELGLPSDTLIELLTDPARVNQADLSKAAKEQGLVDSDMDEDEEDEEAMCVLDEEGEPIIDRTQRKGTTATKGVAGKKKELMVPKGSLFHQTFRKEICEYLVGYPHLILGDIARAVESKSTISDEGVRVLLRTILDAVTACSATGVSHKQHSAFVAVASAEVIPHLVKAAQQATITRHSVPPTIADTVEIAAALLSISPEKAVNDHFITLVDSYIKESSPTSSIGLLRLPSHHLRLLCDIIRGILPSCIRFTPHAENLCRRIGAILVNELPVKYSELKDDSGMALAYAEVVDAVMELLVASQSPVLLKEVLVLFRGTGSHPLGPTMAKALSRFFATQDDAMLLRCADTCVKQFLDPSLPNDVRYAAAKRICVVVLQRMVDDGCRDATVMASPSPAPTPTQKGGTIRTVEQFYKAHVVGLYKVLAEDWPVTRDGGELISSIVSKTCTLSLLELMYRLCTPESTKTTLNEAFLRAMGDQTVPTGKELNDKVIRSAHQALTQSPGGLSDEEIKQLRSSALDQRGNDGPEEVLRYHQSAYNCLAAALMATQTKQDLITRALFVPRKNDLIWEHIIDTSAPLTFEIETRFRISREAVQRLRSDWEEVDEEGTLRPRTSGSKKLSYLSSQYLCDSSLAAAAGHPNAPADAVVDLSQREGNEGSASPADDPVLALTQASQVPIQFPTSLKKYKETLRTSLLDDDTGGKDSPAKKRRVASPQKTQHPLKTQKETLGEDQDPRGFSVSGPSGDLPMPLVDGPNLGQGDLEMDALNANPVMPTLLRLITFLVQMFPAGSGMGGLEMPGWMSEMHRKAKDPSTEQHVRIFIVKVVLNLPGVFQSYASQWFGVMADAAMATGKFGGSLFNYYVRDVCLTALQWGDDLRVTSPENETHAASLLELLLKGSAHVRTFVLRENLEVVKLLVERWKDKIRIGAEHKRAILGWLCQAEGSDKWVQARITGLQLLAVLLANGLPAYDHLRDAALISEESFYSRLLGNISQSRRELCEPAAEVVGMVLLQLSSTTERADRAGWVREKLSYKLKSMHASGEYERFLLVLGKVARHYPAVVDEFLPHALLRMMPHLCGVFRTLALEVLSRRAEHIPGIYKEFSPYAPEILARGHSDSAKQLTVDVLGKCLTSADPDDLSHFVCTLSRNVASQLFPKGALSLDPRVALYDLWIKVFDSHWELLNKEARGVLAELLLGGLQDDSTYLRDRVLRFWDDPTRLPNEAYRRLERLFCTDTSTGLVLFTPQLGDKWLQYSSILLLFLCHRSPDFADTTSFFRDPLVKCEYREMHIDTSVEHRTAVTMTPLFSQSASLPERPAPGFVLATPRGETAPPTQSQTATNFAHYQPKKLAPTVLSQTALLFQPFQPVGTPVPSSLMPPPSATVTTFDGPRRRIRKMRNEDEKVKVHATFATRAVAEREAEKKKQMLQKGSNVQMWRQYREGEVPDIQISPSAVVVPLEALCLYDVDVARLVLNEVFSQLFRGLGGGAVDSRETGSPAGAPPLQTLLGPLVAPVGVGVERGALRSTLTKAVATMMEGMQTSPGVVTFLQSVAMEHTVLASHLTPRTIFQGALRSHTIRSGLLLLEQGIIQRRSRVRELEQEIWRRAGTSSLSGDVNSGAADESAVSAKQLEVHRLGQENIEALEYIAKMYKRLNEEDAARAVVEEQLLSAEGGRAVALVITGEYDDALAAISKVLDNPPTASPIGIEKEKAWLRSEQRHCYEQLLKWDAASAECDNIMDLGDAAIWEPENEELLDGHIRAKVRLTGRTREELAVVLAHALSDRDQRRGEALRARHSLPLALLAAAADDRDAARGHVASALESFLATWGGLPVALRSRDAQTLLASLQPFVEVDEYLTLLMRAEQGRDITTSAQRLLERWSRRTDNFDGDALQWDMLATARSMLCVRLATRVEECRDTGGAGSSAITQSEVIGHQCRLLLQAATCLQAQGHEGPARAFLQQYASCRENDPAASKTLDIDFMRVAVQNTLSRAAGASTPARIRKMFGKAIKYIETEDAKHDLHTTHPVLLHHLLADGYRNMAERFWRSQEEDVAVDAAEVAGISKKALTHYKEAVKAAVLERNGKLGAIEQLGMFADQLLGHPLLGDDAVMKADDLATLMVRSYLSALADGSQTARVRLPRVLEVIGEYPAARRVFAEEIGKIDRWLILPWVSQLLGYLGGPAGDTIGEVLQRLAKKFPQQVFFALGASSQDLERLGSASGELLHRLNQIRSAIKTALGGHESKSVLESFVDALEKLHNPELRFKWWLEEMIAVLRECKNGLVGSTEAGARFAKLWAGLKADCFTAVPAGTGTLNAKFAEKCHRSFMVQIPDPKGGPKRISVSLAEDVAAAVRPLLKDLNSALRSGVLDDLQRKLRDWNALLKSTWSHAKSFGPSPLAMYSTWLAEFRRSPHEQLGMVLLPQQPFHYLHNPTPTRLPDIASFGPTTLVMNSIQKPKKLLFHATDEVEYPFLVKGGEDLRQDQRIQQMFSIFNYCMGRDKKCRQRGLMLRCYSVVTLSPRVGLVEWVDNCQPMKSLIESQLPAGLSVQSHPAARKYHEFVVSVGQAGHDWAAGFRALFGEYGRKDLKAKYDEWQHETTMDPFYLKKALAGLVADHTAFFNSRAKFLSSYAAASVGQWLLGIGDRHLDNFLIDTKTSQVVPIDFGHAFGTATELLHIPELMPFRLTPQIEAVGQPVGRTMLAGGMTCAMAALRAERRLLLDILSIFVREPLATWQRTALRKARKKEDLGGEDLYAYKEEKPQDLYARTKIDLVRRKLGLGNPWRIMAADLAQNTLAASTTMRHKQGMANAKEILRGRPGHNVRADAPDVCRSVAEQVACLVDMATDENILCRTYMGWAPLF